MFGQGKLSVEKILEADEGESFKYVRHSGGFSFGADWETHRYMIPKDCEPLSAGSFYIFKGGIRINREGSLTLHLNPDEEDSKRLSVLFGIPCSFRDP